MAELASWNGHSFVVSPNLIRGFSNLTIEGACETTTKNSNNQKYEERKYGEAGKISMNVELNALLGETDVHGEAMAFYQEANEGASAYFYLGGGKLIPARMMLKSAKVIEIIHAPGNSAKWISCQIALSFVQGSKNDGSDASPNSPNAGSKKASVKSGGDIDKANKVVQQAKADSAIAKGAGLSYQESVIAGTMQANKATQTSANTGMRIQTTTGRISVGADKHFSFVREQ